MSKRIWAALAALLTFATVLAVVPLVNAEPADAHTKTVRRCVADPPISHCWNESVPHTHPKPRPSTPPDPCPPPAHEHGDYGCHWSGDPHPTTTTTTTTTTEKRRKVCPAGTSGTPPNCVPDVCPAGQTGTPPNCVPDVCPAGQTGTPPNCVPDVCPAGQTGTPPNCVPDVCPAGQTGTPPNCVPDVCPAGQTGTPPNCVRDAGGTVSGCGHPSQHKHDKLGCHNRSSGHDTSPTRCGPRSAYHKHDGSGCHVATLDHCHDGQHAHEGSGCHAEDTEHGRGHDTADGRCVGRVPSHAHDGFACHSVNTNHCHDGQHAHDGGGCHPIDHDSCPLGEHEHLSEQTSGCHPTGRDHYSHFDDINVTQDVFESIVSGALCLAAGGLGALACAGGFTWLNSQNAREKQLALRELKKAHDKIVEEKNRKDRPSDDTTPKKTPDATSTTATPKGTPGTTATTTPPKLSTADIIQAQRDLQAGRITPEQHREIARRWDCQRGFTHRC
ncbi:hypothetical protein [Candidatus Poriferisodalis sp.]|uniref:hypothetical protein n=1 Tax=Candidatus Poriferisodalis sp. TaxID=3101277 RepID=UPI003B02759A